MREHAEASAYVQLIVNEGHEAGASLEHSHAQLYALGFVPAAIARERERFVSYNQHTMGGDLLAEIASEEVRRRERLVAIDDETLLICPWASRSPFELRLIPRNPAPSFELDGEVGVGMLRTALRALAARFDGMPELNLWTITAPRGADQFHWHIDIAPRIGIRAGFEMSTGVELNVFPPERAAAELREALG
jgi:UDPglucose--hexose-1-phosphate uridylyltransferase